MTSVSDASMMRMPTWVRPSSFVAGVIAASRSRPTVVVAAVSNRLTNGRSGAATASFGSSCATRRRTAASSVRRASSWACRARK